MYRKAADVRRVGVRADLAAGTVTLTGEVAAMPAHKPRRMLHYFMWDGLVGTGAPGYADDTELMVTFNRGAKMAVVRQFQTEVCRVPARVDPRRDLAIAVVPVSCLPAGDRLSHLYFYVDVNQGKRTVGYDHVRAGGTPVVQVR